MASAQVYRFQRRVNSLQAHHELATQRHSCAVKNYESFSRNMMDSLVTHLAENDKKLKKTKRISKPRTTLPQGLRSTRPGELAKPMDKYSTYTGFPGYGSTDDSCAVTTAYNAFPPHFPINEPKLSGNTEYVRQPLTVSPDLNKEPIFPPPTYDDPSASNVVIPQHSSGPGLCEDYMSGKTDYTQGYTASSQMLSCGFTRYGYFHPSHSRDLSFRRDRPDPYCTDPNFYSGLPNQPANFSAHQQPPPHSSWTANATRERDLRMDYTDPFVSNLNPCPSNCNGKYPDPYGQYLTKPVHPSSHDYRACTRTLRSENLTVIPRAPGSSYTGINPILASTYPVVSGNRSDKNYDSCPQLSDPTTSLGPVVQGNYRPLTFSANAVQVPDHAPFNDINYL